MLLDWPDRRLRAESSLDMFTDNDAPYRQEFPFCMLRGSERV